MRIDGRAARWAQHRETRRGELVTHALRAIRLHGAGVGMEDIAAQAGTSKPVIYRHFGDRSGLYEAVVDAVDAYIHADLTRALSAVDDADLTTQVRELADAYLALVERDPEIYRFTQRSPDQASTGVADPFTGLTERIGLRLAALIAARQPDRHRAVTWGHGVVGFIRAAADTWIADADRRPRQAVVADITALFDCVFGADSSSVPMSPPIQE